MKLIIRGMLSETPTHRPLGFTARHIFSILTAPRAPYVLHLKRFQLVWVHELITCHSSNPYRHCEVAPLASRVTSGIPWALKMGMHYLSFKEIKN